MNQPIGIPSGWEWCAAFYWEATNRTCVLTQLCNIGSEINEVSDWALLGVVQEPIDWRVED